MATDTTYNPNSQENAPEFFRSLARNWHIALIFMSMVITGIGAFLHVQTNLDDLTNKVSIDENQANVLGATVNELNPQISAINAKLDIILKHDGLQ